MLIYITDIDKFNNEKSFLENIKLASFYGINFIQIRLNNLDQGKKIEISKKINEIVDKENTKIIVNQDFESSKIISPYGFHIKSKEKITGDLAKSESGARWISKSIHTKDELYENNNDLDIDAFVIGTIYKSNSHPNGPTLGIEKFMELVRLSKKPVIGIGGINLQNINAIKKSNAIGVAMISELANTNNLEKTINKLKSYYD